MSNPKFNLGSLLDVPTGDYKIPTGFAELSKSLAGGFKRGEMMVFGAMRPGMHSGYSRSMFVQNFIAKYIGELLKRHMAVRLHLYGPAIEIDAVGPDTPEQPDWQRLLVRYARECGESELTDLGKYTLAAVQGMYGWSPEGVPWGPPYVMLNDHSAHVLRWVYENWFAIYRQTGKPIGQGQLAEALYKGDLDFVAGSENLLQAMRQLERVITPRAHPTTYSIREESHADHIRRLNDTENAKEEIVNGRPKREQNYLKLRKGFKK